MSIPFLPTETSFELKCPVCDRGFLLLSEPTLLPHRGALRRVARQALVQQHISAGNAGGQAHPQEVFDLPGWDGTADPPGGESGTVAAADLDIAI